MVASVVEADLEGVENAASAGVPRTGRPFVVMLSGLPGSGKTSLARAIRSQIPAAIIESDAVRLALSPRPAFSADESARVFDLCERAMERLLHRGIAVIMDATNLRERHREPVYALSERAGVPLVIVQVYAGTEIIRRRLEDRLAAAQEGSHLAGWDVYERMWYSRQPIRRAHLRVNTTRGVQGAVGRVVREIEASLER